MTPITIDPILSQRGSEYGDWSEQAALSQALKGLVHGHAKIHGVNLTPMMRESLDMILMKISRIAAGNPGNVDSWLDIEGYAKICRIRLPGGKPEKSPDVAPKATPATDVAVNMPEAKEDGARADDAVLVRVLGAGGPSAIISHGGGGGMPGYASATAKAGAGGFYAPSAAVDPGDGERYEPTHG